METLNFTTVNKSFTYENDDVQITGNVSLGPSTALTYSGSIRTKVNGEPREYVGSFSARKDGNKRPVEIRDTEITKLPTLVTGIQALMAKLEAEILPEPENAETLAEE